MWPRSLTWALAKDVNINQGHDCGKYFGVTLCEIWGLVGGNFEHLPHGIVSRIIIELLPIPLIVLLSPDLTPDDPIPGPEDGSAAHSKPNKSERCRPIKLKARIARVSPDLDLPASHRSPQEEAQSMEAQAVAWHRWVCS